MRASGSPSPPDVQIQHFEGPLDLLLEEVRRQKVAIEDISMAPIVARFLDYFATAAKRNLNLDIEWLHMAAILIDWKSRSLLPRDPAVTRDRDPVREDLIRQLLVHSRQVAQELDRRRASEEARFSRGAFSNSEVPATDAAPASVSVWELIEQAREMAYWIEEQRKTSLRSLPIDQDDVTVAELMDYLRRQLTASNGELQALRLISDEVNASRRSCLFLGLLEMARNQEIEIHQEQVFGPIRLRRAGTFTI